MGTCRRVKLDPYLSPCTKIRTKGTKDLIVNPEATKLLEEKLQGAVDGHSQGLLK